MNGREMFRQTTNKPPNTSQATEQTDGTSQATEQTDGRQCRQTLAAQIAKKLLKQQR